MEAADDVDEDELQYDGVQMSIWDSCQTEGLAGSGRYRHRTVTIYNTFDTPCSPEVRLLLVLQE